MARVIKPFYGASAVYHYWNRPVVKLRMTWLDAHILEMAAFAPFLDTAIPELAKSRLEARHHSRSLIIDNYNLTDINKRWKLYCMLAAQSNRSVFRYTGIFMTYRKAKNVKHGSQRHIRSR